VVANTGLWWLTIPPSLRCPPFLPDPPPPITNLASSKKKIWNPLFIINYFKQIIIEIPLLFTGRKIIPGGSTQAKTNTNTDGVNDNSTNGSEREHKLELFGFDSLVNILGLKRYHTITTYFILFKIYCIVILCFYCLLAAATFFPPVWQGSQ